MFDGHSAGITSLDVFDLDGNIFASGSSDLSFRVWDIRMKNACIRQFSEKDSHISVVKFMPENVNTLAVGNNSEVKIWDLRALGAVSVLAEPDENYEEVCSVEFSKSGRLLFTQYATVIKIWDIVKEANLGQFGHSQNEDLKCISLAEDGAHLISSG